MGPAVPVVVWFHGGGWKYGDKGLLLHIRKVTRHGFAIAAVQYRRSWEAPWPAQRDDAAAAIRWIREHGPEYGIDGTRMGLCGDSAGGHLACLLGLEIGRPRIRAVCAMYPPTDMVALAGRYRGSERYNLITQLFAGPLREKRQLLFDANPVHRVRSSAPPFFLLHGQRDNVVPISHSRDLDSRLRAAGIASRLDEFPVLSHGFRLDEPMLESSAEFFRRNL